MADDLEEANEKLEAERRRLAVTVRSLGDGLLIVDDEGLVASANPRALRLAPEVRVGHPPEVGGLALPAVDEAVGVEVLLEHDGRTLAVTAARLEEGHDGGGVVWTLRDATERARLERLKSEFVATASHELRSPLTSIKGFVELLRAGEGLDERQREFLDIVLVSTNRLVDLVNDLLDVARLEAGRVEVHRRPVDVAEVLDDVVTLLRGRIQTKDQHVDVEVAPDTPRVLADATRLRQMLTNLVTNAHLYTDEGGTLTLRAGRHAAGGVRIEVADTGRGMAPDELEHVFERFSRGAGSTGTPGTGLGLSIVKSLVDLHGGTIDVASTPGEGTTFAITLPAAPQPGVVTRPSDALQRPPRAGARRRARDRAADRRAAGAVRRRVRDRPRRRDRAGAAAHRGLRRDDARRPDAGRQRLRGAARAARRPAAGRAAGRRRLASSPAARR